MNPWGDKSSTDCLPKVTEALMNFEDNFKPDIDHLPDSEQYLAILESKLERIRNDPNFLKQLADKREACMQQLLTTTTQFDDILSLESPVNNSALLRTIAPQRAALHQGEIVELVKYDQLINENEDSKEKQLT